MIKLACETDFVARNPVVQQFARELCQHVAALNPPYISREEVPADVIEKEREIYRDQVKDKPAAAQEKIIEGKLEKFFQDTCLVNQLFVKDNTKTIAALLTEMIAKMGENMKIAQVARYEIGG
jgi:elongation factor Ts